VGWDHGTIKAGELFSISEHVEYEGNFQEGVFRALADVTWDDVRRAWEQNYSVSDTVKWLSESGRAERVHLPSVYFEDGVLIEVGGQEPIHGA